MSVKLPSNDVHKSTLQSTPTIYDKFPTFPSCQLDISLVQGQVLLFF